MTDLSDLVTVLVVTSPTASDPDTTAIEETIGSVRAYDDLARVRLLIGCDGVRPEQRAEMRDGWAEPLSYRYEIKKDLINFQLEKWRPAGILPLPQWGHQANVMRMLLSHVTTPLVLCMEHDTPLTVAPDVKIDWEGCAETILSGELHLIRFLHESHVLDVHRHLFLDYEPDILARVPYLRTAQWSQRPHLARTDWYRGLIETYFATSSRTMCEDCLVGPANYAWRVDGVAGWERWKLAVYADPEPTLQRSYHLDGRSGGDKYEMLFSYVGETPEGAPAATLSRVFE